MRHLSTQHTQAARQREELRRLKQERDERKAARLNAEATAVLLYRAERARWLERRAKQEAAQFAEARALVQAPRDET